MGEKRVLAVIGGSGLYAIEGLGAVEEIEVETPWGAPSGPLSRVRYNGVDLLFLARHGAGHRLSPGEINYRANIDALKRAGATDILSVSACGSLREHLEPGRFVIVDQFIDRTTNRASSFFGTGFVAHVSMAHPVCSALGDALEAACKGTSTPYHRGGVYICIDGPQFSSYAESTLYRQWGADVIGMTNMPEAKLAREAELPYASLAMVTDYDCWRAEEDHVDVAGVIEVMHANTVKARRVLAAATAILGPERDRSPQGIETGLDNAVITPLSARDPEMIARLGAVAGRFIATGK